MDFSLEEGTSLDKAHGHFNQDIYSVMGGFAI
jgi:hypothetical protein